MITVRKSDQRGHADHGWLDTRHTFSFADYHDPQQMGYRSLRVINEDRVAPGAGFPAHGHRDMEILTCVLEGSLAHKDSLGNGSTLSPGEVQHMSAGRGVRHSEFNASASEPVHFLQIWILPEREGLEPVYGQKAFPAASRSNVLRLVAAPGGREGSLPLRQDAEVRASLLEPGAVVRHPLRPGRGVWLQVVRGAVDLNGRRLDAGDGAAVEAEAEIVITGIEPAEFLLFDLA